ncbi:glycoside hydrolase family 1 protein [Nocardia carnea]|uniref:glycoside hydrolase family 1 protein n=1 Tax=Nocardia carnea TaxID=37328 RepID=UPI0024557E02|nr:family 1 glycosylhydrolase [Nocardia carnea]
MTFPDTFLWGTATAAHQVEGGNTASDFWAMEHAPGSLFAEPSGDACDHYRLFRDDLALLAGLGFTAYRFSIEWARVEPEDGVFSRAAIAHYRDVLAACHEFGLTPMVTLHHFTSPRWLMRYGGWEYAGTPERFAAYCRAVLAELGDSVPYVCTINEANIGPLLRGMLGISGDGAPVGIDLGGQDWRRPAAEALATTPDKLNPFLFTFSDAGIAVVKQAHMAAREAIRAVSPASQVGITLSLQDFQPLPGATEIADRMWAEQFEEYLPALQGDDFLGVQNYCRARIGTEGILPQPADAELTQAGYEYYPQALEPVLRRAATAGLPLFVTENGIATADDDRRVAFIETALDGVGRALADGVDIRGYFYWSALDNFEWMLGYTPRFGLIAVDRETQRRTPKNSAYHLGAVAGRHRRIRS